MARHVSSELEAKNAQLEAGETIALALVISEGETEAVKQRLEEFDGDLDRELPSGVLLVSIPGEHFEEFLQTSNIESASSPDRMEILS